jgi:hypothetical protein
MALPSFLAELKVDKKGSYSVSSKLGEGAYFGAVYSLLDDETGESGFLAVKVTQKPKRTRNRNTPNERNARLLHNERAMYENTLAQLQGDMIPRLPKRKECQVYGTDEEGAFPV